MSIDINVKQLEYLVDDFGSTLLKLEISGKDIDHSVINSLRKVCINQIPTYAFHPSKINIFRNSSVYDNSYMKERLSQLPIMKLKHDVKYLSTKYYKDVNFADPKLVKHKDDTYDVDIYIKAKNSGPEHIINISTNDIKLTINNKVVNNSEYYSEKYPILLTQLRTGEEFECSMKGVLAVGEFDSIFNASNSYYEEITENKYEFMIESSGQFEEYELLIIGCEIIKEKLQIIKENVNRNQYQIIITENNSMILEILNEDYTCGGPINYHLQNSKSVIFSGITNPDFMQKNIIIKFKVDDKSKPIDVFNESVDKTDKMFTQLMDSFKKLAGLANTKINKKMEKSVKTDKSNIKKK